MMIVEVGRGLFLNVLGPPLELKMMMNKDDMYATSDILGDNTVDDECVCVCVCVCENKICTFRKRGICEQHLVQDTKHTKKWRDRGRGLGCVTICVNKYLCKVRKSGPQCMVFLLMQRVSEVRGYVINKQILGLIIRGQIAALGLIIILVS